jgi:hypothetical protein
MAEPLTRRSVFRLTALSLAGAVAAPLAALLPKSKARRFVASVMIEPRFQASIGFDCPPSPVLARFMVEPGRTSWAGHDPAQRAAFLATIRDWNGEG